MVGEAKCVGMSAVGGIDGVDCIGIACVISGLVWLHALPNRGFDRRLAESLTCAGRRQRRERNDQQWSVHAAPCVSAELLLAEHEATATQ